MSNARDDRARLAAIREEVAAARACPHDGGIRARQQADRQRAIRAGRLIQTSSGVKHFCSCCAGLISAVYRYCGYCSADGYELREVEN